MKTSDFKSETEGLKKNQEIFQKENIKTPDCCCCKSGETLEASRGTCDGGREERLLKWEQPALEDVSGKVMAQPYIRFT
jgi:hypothetical protein